MRMERRRMAVNISIVNRQIANPHPPNNKRTLYDSAYIGRVVPTPETPLTGAAPNPENFRRSTKKCPFEHCQEGV